MPTNINRFQHISARKLCALVGLLSATAAPLALIGASSPEAAPTTNGTTATSLPTIPTTAPPALEAFAHAWDSVAAYRATVTVFAAKGNDVQNLSFTYDFRKPSSFIVHVIDGPNAGVTLTWDGGPTVQASRGHGLFAALLKRTIPLHDPLVTTIRGASMDQLSYGAILAHTVQTPGDLKQSPGEAIAGVPTQMLSLVPNDPTSDAGLSREVIDISTLTQLPIRIEGYEGGRLVRKIDFADVQPGK
jgi:hypothetical protein